MADNTRRVRDVVGTVGGYRGLPGPKNLRPKPIPSASTPPAETPPIEQPRAKRRKAS
jgi:hypothetical protein